MRSFPLDSFRSWEPFRLDALGLVTLLGADEVANALGSLNHNILTDYLPVFGSFKVASDQIATINPGYSLYNLSDGIWVTELAPWFTRWLSVNLEHNYTIIDWKVEQEARERSSSSWFARLLGFVANAGLLTLAAVQADWYGIANAVSMICSVTVKLAICHVYREAINAQAQKFNKQRVAESTSSPNGKTPTTNQKKLLIVLPDGRLAMGYLPAGVIPMMLDSKAKSSSRVQLWPLRAVGWLGFGIQIVAIGQASLLTQIVTVAVMTLASVATIYNVGVIKKQHVGRWMTVDLYDAEVAGRQPAYVMLEPDEHEEDYMRARGLLPDKNNVQWLDAWNEAQKTWATNKAHEAKTDKLGISRGPLTMETAGAKAASQTIGRAPSPQATVESQQC